MAIAADLLQFDALGPGKPYRARTRAAINEVSGKPVGELSLVPPLFINRAITQLRAAEPLPLDERLVALVEAGERFHHDTVDGLDPAEYAAVTSRVTGLPIQAVRAASARLVESTAALPKAVTSARPRGATVDWRDPAIREGSALWSRCGEVFAVHAAGNHPGVHAEWLEALALGYRVAVRPSRRDPLTPHRLVACLRAAGFADAHVVLLPTEHHDADALLRAADLSMVYGGEEVVSRYRREPTVRVMGPGRAKILVAADSDWTAHLDTIVDSVAFEGGVGCVNATAIFVEGDPAPLAQALTDRLSELPNLPPDDDRARLPVWPQADAERLAASLRQSAAGAHAWLGGDGVAHDLGDGSAVLRPAVYELDSAGAAQVRHELPFPCVWVAPWRRELGTETLGDTLVLTALTHDPSLIDSLAAEPTIANLYVGAFPTCWSQPHLPHDGYLADFLMRSKACVRGYDLPANRHA
jgi:acyl-CoA reductase-like NAD-dependent aldehyde dehydrogenase